MTRYYPNRKQESDNLKKIYIKNLKKWGYLKQGFHSGLITWTSGYSEDKSSVSIQTRIFPEQKSLRIMYTQRDVSSDEKKDFDYEIPLINTPCYFGGYRYWFLCPWYKNGKYCGRRIAVLYKNGDYFACRHCYNLTYESKNQNRRHYLAELGKLFEIENAISKLREKIVTPYYRGKPTKKYKRLLNLLTKFNGSEMNIEMQKIAKKLKK